jgi:D-beta-D-heptose 7-phosphate kinase/D-beta-D-heptose 1-phosphate adenosyltransferase
VHELELALAARERARAAGRSVVFTNGCFDLLHAGHVRYLQWARAQGDLLIVGLNDDASVRALKGPQRPILPFEQRRVVIGALSAVDAVVGFSESTPIALIEALRPDLHVKSSAYRLEDLPERFVVERGGGRVLLAPHLDGLSTTEIIAKIRASYA